ncbi:hypothetical protein [Paenibacillus sp. N3.4]|uniref:hypothetical protein n=1 Tax=Paenibacillus sp. N3.4 TaxID=2603222 RepID=UPI0011C7A621|nr:hypothetical protein [Paenibacillus sp. N3.4]TXK84167.1 hypothetical protein FU659_09940 [Paenibacillus sp. N3.4]
MFHPNRTEYEIRFDDLPTARLYLTVTQAEDWGAAARLSIYNSSPIEALTIRFQFVYGGMAFCERTITAKYFTADMEDTTDNTAAGLKSEA